MRRRCALSDKRIESQAPLSVSDGRDAVAALGLLAGKPFERRAQLPPQRLRLGELPVVEDGAIAKPEPLHEVAARELDGFPHLTVLDKRSEAGHVEVDGAGLERDAVPSHGNPAIAKALPEHREGSPQSRASTFRIRVWPEEVRERVARMWAPRDGEVGEQRDCLTSVDVEWHAIDVDERRPEEMDVECRHERNECSPGHASRNDLRTHRPSESRA